MEEAVECTGENANSIPIENRTCSGFEENIVLAVKECFFEDEIRCILIKKDCHGKRVKYFSRTCTNFVDEKRVCDDCDRWFMNLSGLPFMTTEAVVKSDIENFLDVKMDVEKESVEVDHKENVKKESEFDDCGGKVKVEAMEEFEPVNDGWSQSEVKVRKVRSMKAKKKRRRIPPENKVEGGFICRHEGCGKIFQKRKGWLKHDKTHEAKKTCDVCGMLVSKLKEHMRRVHGVGALNSVINSGLGEDEDNKNWHSGFAGFVGGKQSERQRKYSEDKTDEGIYVCRFSECKKLFDKKKAYLKHIYLIHEGGNEKRKRKKICEICGALITANNMKQHVRTVHTHKHEKNFACEHCGKEFKYRSELTVHLTHHTGELNFTCTGCAKKFRRAAEARLCERGHRGIYNFSCNMCDYKTHKKHHLDRHLKSHLKSTPFSCPICGFKSGRKDNLKQHVEKRHATVGTPIKQLEEMYPDMYKIHETCEAAEVAKQEAIAEHRAKMEQDHKLNLDLEDPRNSLLHQAGGAGGGELLSPEQHQQMSQQQQQTMGLANDVVLSETHDIKHFVPDQKPREQQYIVTSDQQRLIHDHRNKVSMEYGDDRMTTMEHTGERMIHEQRDRMLLDQRERMAQEQRERMVQEQRERMMQERMVQEQRDRMLAEQRERERLLAEQRERERLIAEQRERDRMAQEMRDRMFQEHRDRMTTTNSLAEVWQRMRSLDQ